LSLGQIALATMLPVVILTAPLIQRARTHRLQRPALWLLYREHSVPQFAFFAVLGLHDFLPKSLRMSVAKAPACVATV
jgi:hypothetical protein